MRHWGAASHPRFDSMQRLFQQPDDDMFFRVGLGRTIDEEDKHGGRPQWIKKTKCFIESATW